MIQKIRISYPFQLWLAIITATYLFLVTLNLQISVYVKCLYFGLLFASLIGLILYYFKRIPQWLHNILITLQLLVQACAIFYNYILLTSSKDIWLLNPLLALAVTYLTIHGTQFFLTFLSNQLS